jgi:signal transduction histidine kinase
VRPEPLGAETLLRDAADRFSTRAAETGRGLDVEADPTLAVLADPTRVEQALDNLVENAFTHGAGRIELRARPRGQFVELHVLDEGDGFPPGFAERAFDRFSRADESRHRGGSGLGLAIVAAVAQAHGGEAGTSDTAGGADVWIALERAPAVAPSEPALAGDSQRSLI